MVKKIIILAFYMSLSFANSTLELVKNLLNEPSKNSQLELLFLNKSYIDDNGNFDIAKISQILKINSLITLILPSSQNLKLNFKARADEVMFFKILSDVLSDAGYVYFIPTDLILREGKIDYTIQVESQYILDPGTLYKLLKEHCVYIENIRRIGVYDYEYDLNFSNAVLKTNIDLSLDTPKSLEKPLKDYVLNLNNASYLIIDANILDNWFPKIFFLDKNLNLIQAVKSKSKNNHFSQLIPNGAMYAIISDMYSLDNIRRGLKITLKSQG